MSGTNLENGQEHIACVPQMRNPKQQASCTTLRDPMTPSLSRSLPLCKDLEVFLLLFLTDASLSTRSMSPQPTSAKLLYLIVVRNLPSQYPIPRAGPRVPHGDDAAAQRIDLSGLELCPRCYKALPEDIDHSCKVCNKYLGCTNVYTQISICIKMYVYIFLYMYIYTLHIYICIYIMYI